MATMKKLLLTGVAVLLLATGAAHAQEGPDNPWPVVAEGDWECRNIGLRRTGQKVTNHGGWISFHLYTTDGKYGVPALPRKVTIQYEYKYPHDRVTINGKLCRKAPSQ